MRVVHVVYGLEFGGIETMLVNIVNEQVSMGHDIHVVCINDTINSDLRESLSSDVKFHNIGRPVGSKNPYYILKFNYKISSISPDVIHIHTSSMIRYFIGKWWRKKMCVTKHDVHEDKYLHYYSNIYAISEAVKEFVQKEYALNSKVIINGINVQKIKYTKTTSDSDTLKIVQVSRLNHTIKGQHILIKAIKLVKERGYKVSLDFIGEGPSMEYLKGLINEYELNEEVKLLGGKSQQYIFENLCNYHLFVQSSINEGFGLTVAEAMAAKVPVLISENQGPLEIIDNGKYGSSFKNGDAEDCAEKIIAFIEQAFSEEMIEEAYKRVEKLYSVRLTAEKYIEEYNSILNTKR